MTRKKWIIVAIIILVLGSIGSLLENKDKKIDKNNNTPTQTEVIKKKSEPTKKEYHYTFIEEKKVNLGQCLRIEWIYTVPNDIKKEDIEPILKEIYEKRKGQSQRTVISLYTEEGMKNANLQVAIGFLNDSYNCEEERKVEIKNNFSLYNSLKNL
ncbi:hypothetical protein KGV52_01310 [Candidatus Gracilibacteria bacterium]|nr:hypothetical protein [Candidatus Gracilibacteria bacterium]